MNKAGVFPYMSTRNNNFSNRNQMGSMCVASGATGKCAAGQSCQETIEKDLLKKLAEEKSDGTKKMMLIELLKNKKEQLASKRAELDLRQKAAEDKLLHLQNQYKVTKQVKMERTKASKEV